MNERLVRRVTGDGRTGWRLTSRPCAVVRSVVPEAVADGGQGVPERLLTVKQAAELAGCCEETVRRAYWTNQLRVQPFGSRSIRIHPADLRAWMASGMRTQAAA